MAPRSHQMGRPEGRQGLAAHYRRLLAEQATSGMSVAEFAEEQGLSAATLYSWRRRLAGASASGAARSSAASLVEVTVAEPLPRRAQSLVLRLGEQYAIELAEDFDGEALGRLLDLLEC